MKFNQIYQKNKIKIMLLRKICFFSLVIVFMLWFYPSFFTSFFSGTLLIYKGEQYIVDFDFLLQAVKFYLIVLYPIIFIYEGICHYFFQRNNMMQIIARISYWLLKLFVVFLFTVPLSGRVIFSVIVGVSMNQLIKYKTKKYIEDRELNQKRVGENSVLQKK
ncbi:MAG: hypothetical protein ACRC6X_06575 [Culicoidibacterales bacterium]